MMICDGRIFLGKELLPFSGLSVHRIECQPYGREGRSYAVVRCPNDGYYPLCELDNFRAGEEDPQAVLLLAEIPPLEIEDKIDAEIHEVRRVRSEEVNDEGAS